MEAGEIEQPKTLTALWEEYKKTILDPSNFDDETKRYMKGAFFSGVLSTTCFLAALDNYAMDTAEAMYRQWESELESWAMEHNVKAGKVSGESIYTKG